MMSEILSDLPPAKRLEKIEGYTQIIQQQVMRMDGLIDDFLDLDAIEQANLKLKTELVDFNQQVRQVVELMTHLTEKRQQSLTIELSVLPIHVAIDTRRFQQIVANLLTNAAKYTPEGGKICVTTAVQSSTAVLQITDNGPGMMAEEQLSAFDLYFRADMANEADRQGRGLGLYIVKMLTEAHGGHVELSSIYGQGCTVQVYFPWIEDAA